MVDERIESPSLSHHPANFNGHCTGESRKLKKEEGGTNSIWAHSPPLLGKLLRL